ncbi:hypothetical protein ScalyP_jg9149 [Parmales sp. scaly parma]|nr:hypothetical protein ScalyP_jg9149 [Parmales sp. scaly parma]
MVSLLSVLLLLLLLSSHAFSAVIPEDVLSQAKIDFITYSDPNPNSQFFEQPSYIGSWVMQICFCMYSTAQARPKNLLSVWRTMIIGSIDSSLFSGENPGSCKEFVKFLLKGKFQLDHCVELQFIFHFACIFAFGAKWSFSVWKRLAYISSQAWNLQFLEKKGNKEKGKVVTNFIASEYMCKDDTIVVFKRFIPPLKKLVGSWGDVIKVPKVEDDLLKPFFKDLLVLVEGIVADHEK